MQQQYQASRHSAGKVPEVVSVQAIAFYDPKDGRIRHMHHGVTLAGAQAHDKAAFERQAASHAAQMGVKLDGLKSLHVPNFEHTGGRFRLDVKAQKLVRLSVPDKLLVFRNGGQQKTAAS